VKPLAYFLIADKMFSGWSICRKGSTSGHLIKVSPVVLFHPGLIQLTLFLTPDYFVAARRIKQLSPRLRIREDGITFAITSVHIRSLLQ